MAAGLFKRSDGLVNFVSLHARACFQSVCCCHLRLCRCLRLQQFTEEDMSVRKCLFYNESVAAVILERVPKCRRFRCALGGMEVTGGLDDFP